MVSLQDMKWPEVQDCLGRQAAVLLPVGSTEQHGRHAPLGTDTFIAMRLAEDAARRTGAVCAPALPFGWSPHHLVLPGTISVRAAVLQELLIDTIRSMAAHGFARFVVVNGHRITNLPWMQLAAHHAQSTLDVTVVIFDPAYMAKEVAPSLGFGMIGHADELETSQLLFLRPDLVDLTRAVDSPGHARRLYHVDPRAGQDTLCYVPSTRAQMQRVAEETGGSTGNPTRARADLGRRLHEHLVDRLVETIESIR
jgi:creatinine amidohydrolase